MNYLFEIVFYAFFTLLKVGNKNVFLGFVDGFQADKGKYADVLSTYAFVETALENIFEFQIKHECFFNSLNGFIKSSCKLRRA